MSKRNEISASEWVKKYDIAIAALNNGDDTLLNELTDATWYDWFCHDTSLPNKTIKLGKIVKFIVNKTKAVNPNTTYVWFKNNCPFNGSLYDDIRFSDMISYDNQFVLTPSLLRS